MKKALTIFLWVISVTIFAQTQNVTGKITDSTGDPIPGVTVAVKGTTTGSISDLDGNYTMSGLSSDDVLVYSFVGMLGQEIVVGDQTTIVVTMASDAVGLDEIVAIGYGTRKKSTLTGAVATISGDELLKSHAANLTSGLAGQVPGLVINQRSGKPGSEELDIFVRGKSTLGDNNNPLLIIDGIPQAIAALSRLNPNDIASMSVLKDASASIYGVNASNGVILVKTKRGTSSEPVFSLTSTFSAAQPTVKPNWTNSYQTAIAMNEESVYGGGAEIYSPEDIELFRTGSSPLTHPGQDVDWYDETYNTWSPQQRHAFSVRGGDKKVKYFLSAEYLDQKGRYKNSDAVYYKQYQVRSNLDFQATKNLNLSVDLAAQLKDRSEEQNGDNARLRAKQARPETIFTYPNGLVGTMQYGLNPVIMGSTETGYDATESSNFTSTFRWDYTMDYVTQGLSFAGYAKYGVDNSKNTNWLNTWDTYSYDESTGEYIAVPSGWTTLNPALEKEYKDEQSSQVNAKINYVRSFGDHAFDVFAGIESRKGQKEELFGSRGDYLTNIVEQINEGDITTSINGGTDSEWAALSYYGRFNYGFKEKYLVDLTLRADGSYKFPEGEKFGVFPSVSTAWRISEESFFKDNINFFNYMKFRASWGKMGLDNTDPFQYLATYSQPTTNYRRTYLGETGANVTSYTSDGPINTEITWELQESIDFGVDMQFANGLVNVTADYFKNKRTDILISSEEAVPDYYGLELPDENIGKVDSWGFDSDVSFNKKVNSDFSYSLGGTFTFARNRAVYLAEAEGVLDFQKKEGHSVDVIDVDDSYGTDALNRLILIDDGLYQNIEEINASAHLAGAQPGDIKYVDQLTEDTNNDGVYDTADGVIDDKDRVRIDKSRTPEIVYGINLGANYKGFDFIVRLQGQARAWAMVQPEMLRYDQEFFVNRWQEEGDNMYPKTYCQIGGNTIGDHNNDQRSTFWLENVSFLRVKTVELGYSLPETLLSNLRIKDARVFVSAENLFSFDNMKISRDPELDSWNSYEISRVVTAGINLNF